MSKAAKLTVFYDGSCPLCEREIAFYRRRKGAGRISWVDVSRSSENQVATGLSKDRALARFHVLTPNGTIVSGGMAFAKLWAALPSFRIWGRLFQAWPLDWILHRAYVLFLRIRPRLQAIVSRRQSLGEGAFPTWLIRDLRSDHAGETGAVAIYQGILAVSRNSEIRVFAEAHLKTERQHLELIAATLPQDARSIFTPLWRTAGFLTGAIPSLFGRNAVFTTIDAVETFVDRHYAEQVERLSREGTFPEICALLERCRVDETRHRDEARQSLRDPAGAISKVWRWMVGTGSAAGVAVARRL